MAEIFETLKEPIYETLYLTFVPLLLSVIFGFIIGTIIFITASDTAIIDTSKSPLLRIINRIADALVNIFRSIPYLILLIWVLPIANALTGSMIGAASAVPSLVFSATPFFARMVVIAFKEIDKGTIEASKALGANTFQIIFKVLIEESKPALISGITVTAINLVSYSAMAGAVGAGGLGFVCFLLILSQMFTQGITFLIFVAQTCDNACNRIFCFNRVNIKDEAVLVIGNRFERENFRSHLTFKIHDKTNHRRRILTDTHGFDVGVVGRDVRNHFLKFARQSQAFDIHDQAIRHRRAHEKVFELDRLIMLKRDAGIFFRRPHADIHHLGGVRQADWQKRER